MFNVHLIRSEGVDDAIYDQVVSLLKQFPGPMRFIVDSEYQKYLLKEDEISEKKIGRNTFNKAKEEPLAFNSEMLLNESSLRSPSYSYPSIIRVASWESLFKKCRDYRLKNQIGPLDFVVLITELNNEHNWFSASDTNGDNNIFIHSDHWNYFSISDERFPIAYLIATGILKKIAFGTYKELEKRIHRRPRGCISDFCGDKREIILKMRTGDICKDCMDVIREKISDKTLLSQCYSIMDHIQNQLRFRERFEVLQQPSRILITPRNEPIQFIDMDASQLRLSPIQKAIYILFLEKSEGIHFNRIDAFRDRLSVIYDEVGHNFTLANKANTINDLTDPTENSLSSNIAKIKRKLIDHLGEDLASHYIIDGPNGEAKKIPLDRSLVDWNGFLQSS